MPLTLAPYLNQIEYIEKSLLAQAAASKQMTPHHKKTPAVHVVYGGAQMFSADFVAKLGRLAADSFLTVASDGLALKSLLRKNWTSEFSVKVFESTLDKLRCNPVEDYRIDFEDGYGLRPDDEEDKHAVSAAEALVEAAKAGALPAHIGIRPKPLATATLKRSLRTLILFTSELSRLGAKKAGLNHLIVTLPKVTSEAEVSSLVEILEKIEEAHNFGSHFFSIELLVETPQSFLDSAGAFPLPRMIAAARGRCTGVHFGVYDFTSSLGLGSAGQSLTHFSCDVARFLMQISVGLTEGVALSDGVINMLPIAPHKAKGEVKLSSEQVRENTTFLGEAWRTNFDQMMRSLKMGFYQGWDLHPSQVAIRHLVNRVYVFEEFEGAAKRLKGFIDRSAQATRLGDTFDDRASALGLINFMERAVKSGIIGAEDLEKHGVSFEVLKKL